MPGRNIYKQYVPESFYHIYNRGVNKQLIFVDRADYLMFESLLSRYLSEDRKQINGAPYPSFSGRLEVLAYCLMPNHFHLFIYQHDNDAMREFVKCLTVSYSMYFNKRWNRVGPLYQQRYRAVWVNDESYLQHISRYIHLNPKAYETYEWSSYRAYIGRSDIPWLIPNKILSMFSGPKAYAGFVADFKLKHDELEDSKHALANYNL